MYNVVLLYYSSRFSVGLKFFIMKPGKLKRQEEKKWTKKRLKQRLCSDWIKVPAFCAVSLFLKLQSLLGKRRTSQVCT